MGQKGMRAMSPLQAATANDLRVKLGRGRDLPEEAKPKRAPKAKPAVDETGAPVAKAPRQKSADGAAGPKVTRKKTTVPTETEEVQLPQPTEEIKPAATLFRHTAASAPVVEPEPAPVAPPAPVIAPPPAAVAPPPVVTSPVAPPVAPPSVAPPRVTPPPVVRREPTVLRPTPPAVQPRPVVAPPAPAAPPAPPKRVAPAAPTPARPAAPAPAAATPPPKVEVKPEPPKPESKPVAPEPPEEIKRELVKLPESVTVGELAAAMRHKSGEVIKALLELGVMATVNEVL